MGGPPLPGKEAHEVPWGTSAAYPVRSDGVRSSCSWLEKKEKKKESSHDEKQE